MFPIFQSHKVVEAFRIEGTRQIDDFMWNLFPKQGMPAVVVTSDFITKHNPQVGGYWVRYEDGYESYSPAHAFESGYTPMDTASSNPLYTPPPITGYRALDQQELDLMNAIKAKGNEIGQLIERIRLELPEHDPLWANIATTDLQKGFMALGRAVARPDCF